MVLSSIFRIPIKQIPYKANSFLKLVKPFVAYTYSDFYFSEYSIDGKDFAGKKLTGISPHVFNGGIDLEIKPGIYLYSTARYVDQFPILDNNSSYNNAYWVINQKIGFRKTILKKIPVDLYAGVDNILNQKYSSYVNLNAKASGGGARFYNPSPGRNYYSGISVKYLF
jgi:iron complex outermembrane recepter protein